LQEEQLRKVIAAAVGASPERGDAVVIQSLAGVMPAPQSIAAGLAGALPEAETANGADMAPRPFGGVPLPQLLLGAVLVIASALLLYRAGRRRSPLPATAQDRPPLSEAERTAALQRVRDWMSDDPRRKA
jgi:flagellar M-ring protein FliF